MKNQTEWRWADPTGQQRLVREDELRAALQAGVIPANAPVWTVGWTTWKPAHDVPELGGANADHEEDAAGEVPAPPSFVVAAQDAFEGKSPRAATGPAEPPPPPRYVPAVASTHRHVPVPPISDTKVDAPVMPAPSPRPVAVRAATKPPTRPPPLPAAAKKSSGPPPLPPGAKRPASAAPTASLAKTARSPGATPKPRVPLSAQPRSTYTKTQRPPAGVAPPAEALPASSRPTVQIAPAPPPMPKLDPAPAVHAAPPPREASSKFPTLLMFDDEPSAPVPAAIPPPPAEDVPPIVVPPPEPSHVTNAAVTRPPPWGEGAVEMETTIPKSPRVPAVTDQRPSDAPPRPMELSSSDLTSEARIEVVKATPLAPPERPHPTMLGLGPDKLAENRAALEHAVHDPPPSASDVAATTKQTPPPEEALSALDPPPPRPSGAALHDLRAMSSRHVASLAEGARRAYADLRERTKDKPPWFLPVIAGSLAFAVLILFAAGVKALVHSSGSAATATAASSSGSAPASLPAAPTVTGTATGVPPPAHAKPMVCATTGPSRSVAPKALVASGVEVVAVDGKLALGFAPAPKEATVELLDPATGSSVSALHLRETARVRRVLALDASKAAVDVNRKGDVLLGRRTLRAATPIDVGESDGAVAWAPHGSDQALKLWPLPHPDARVEALRGDALPNGAGFAVAFRHAGGVWFGAFGGTPPAPFGPLLHVQGLGPRVGSPAIAASGDRVMVAWADRASKDDPWSVRYATFRPHDTSVEARSFALPTGGLGEHAMSPSIAPLGEGRFLLVWTEGPVSSHQVRGISFLDGEPTGAPFTASSEGVNAGQGQAAVLADGRGVVAFLAAAGHGFEVHAAPIHCAEK